MLLGSQVHKTAETRRFSSKTDPVRLAKPNVFYKKLVTIYIYRKNSLCSIFLVNCSVHDNKCYCNDFIKSFANGVSEVSGGI
jgi:hypothetical protein